MKVYTSPYNKKYTGIKQQMRNWREAGLFKCKFSTVTQSIKYLQALLGTPALSVVDNYLNQ